MKFQVPDMPDEVGAVFETFPSAAKKRLHLIRSLIFECAANLDGVGPINETLKWGEPSYLTRKTGSGSTIRIAWKERNPDKVAMYFNCQTTLVGDMKRKWGGDFEFADNRAVFIDISGRLPQKAVKDCLGMALTYHQRKKSGRRR